MSNRRREVVAEGRAYPTCTDAFDAVCQQENVTLGEREEADGAALAGGGDPNAPVDILGRTIEQRREADNQAEQPAKAGKPGRKKKTTRKTRARKGS